MVRLVGAICLVFAVVNLNYLATLGWPQIRGLGLRDALADFERAGILGYLARFPANCAVYTFFGALLISFPRLGLNARGSMIAVLLLLTGWDLVLVESGRHGVMFVVGHALVVGCLAVPLDRWQRQQSGKA